MTWLTAFPDPPFRVRALVVAISAACAAASASAQTTASRQHVDEKDLPVVIEADRMTGRPDREVSVECNVEITRGQTRITSDRATYRLVEDQVEASGNLRMQRFGDEYRGDELKLRVETMRGYVTNPSYRLEKNNANGRAQRIDFEGEDQATIVQGTYSTCEGPDPDWYLRADTLHLDNGRDVGQAGKTVLYFKGAPIIGAPGMSFPLSDARKSGVLPPTFGTTNQGGFDLTVPYYFNIAPNRDLTVFPTLIARRGIQIGGEARYLGESYAGETRLEFLPQDRQANMNRYAVTSLHRQSFGSKLNASLDWSAASDLNYPTDFSRTITNAFQPLLWRNFNVTYSSTYWRTKALISSYQFLQPQDPARPTRLYKRLPQLSFNAGRMDINGFDLGVNAEATYFSNHQLVSGKRVFVTPHLAYPVIQPSYFITPKLSFDATRYELENIPSGSRTSSQLSRTLPIFSLDSGLVFEREASLFGTAVTQTLEPRLFYVRIPYKDQSNFPLFDTGFPDLSNFAQLFSENRFIGHDRIGDANQLTAAVTSRYIREDGEEIARLAIGQRFNSSAPRVSLTSDALASKSDLIFSGSGKLLRSLSAEAKFQYSETLQRMDRVSLGTSWQPGPKRVLNVYYRKDLLENPNRKEVEFSTQWPVAKRWYGVGRINYSLQDKKIAEGLLGAEYKADCWVFRMVAQKTATGVGKSASSFFFQLELNGLARLGSNPLEALRNSIPGYQQLNQP